MLEKIIRYSLKQKLIVILISLGIVGFGVYALFQIPIGAVPDVTNNQVQVITTSRNLATEDVEKYLTYPVELEMANLPGVKEIRSVSKFGLSVVTIVFDDDLGTYLPRQLIAEKLKSAQANIPDGFGNPFMGPITTGLGEIYQYTLEVDSAHQDQYSVTDLRTIQDWVVRRQLSGIPGVVEVNTWGGFLKQYRVSVKPELLRSHQISITEVFKALEANNGLAGGAYIEKEAETYFIRSEGLATQLEDLENIVVAQRAGVPVLVKDLAKVEIGSAPRFGAITANGEGEKVMGQIMMLKDANSKAVISAVKERIDKIEQNLPPGIHINPFLERSDLIAKTTFTIAENLILGCLIVIFVVVVLLGNWRSGLVVASVIPISLLFAISLMYIFGIDANLMSLGAIDFGIIIDGAVIIVEFIAYQLVKNQGDLQNLNKEDRSQKIDDITENAANKMMHSAVFGQLIIIIVFIPILSLAGVEGKMFRPMALVFSFALIGAMFLCFSYVPVMASLFFRSGNLKASAWSNRLMNSLARLYKPSLDWALRRKALVLSAALALFVSAIVLFSKMGAEFVPTLDEGDYVIQPILKTGTSLSRTVELTTRMEKILMKFPEVEQVVSRIGAAEVPTDPMSMEESDVIIKLKPHSEWKTAESKDDLAEAFKSALMEIPGVEYEFTQPIEMRFNELITGVRADLAIKIFGEDLDKLSSLAYQIKNAIGSVEGASDISVEKIVGLPQLKVKFDRARIARYGLNIADLNRVISTGFAGAKTGVLFEGEKQFDISLRLDESNRDQIEDIQSIQIQSPDGRSIPLRELAQIELTKGPAKVSRDNTRRRIVVGVNVRNRDLESVVMDVQSIIDAEISLPENYSIEYGGQFQNLRSARTRLSYAVPVALVLIFLLLYFAFDSVKDALLIYTAIPLSAVGGVFLLYLRGMPFSISAGVGFIALFGIAVLNGIVLIEEFKALKEQGLKDVHQRILTGAVQRLRPVLLTASAAALGFLPMAISSSAGAEVQRPLATVVIGGLISSTALTLMVLPLLYSWWEGGVVLKAKKLNRSALLILLLLLVPIGTQAQESPKSLKELENLALEHNFALHAAQLESQRQKSLVPAAISIPATQFYYSYDQNNIAQNNAPIRVWGIDQEIHFPTYYYQQSKAQELRYERAETETEIQKQQLLKQVGQTYYEAVYWASLLQNYQHLDSLYRSLAFKAEQAYKLGQSNYLQKLAAQSKAEEIKLKLEEYRAKQEQIKSRMEALVQIKLEKLAWEAFPEIEWRKIDTSNYAGLDWQQKNIALAQAERKVSQSAWWPALSFGYFQGTNSLPNAQTYRGMQVGLAIPLWYGSRKATAAAASLNYAKSQSAAQDYRLSILAHQRSLEIELLQYQKTINHFKEVNYPLVKEIRKHSDEALKAGEISYLEYVQLQERASTLETEYLYQQWQYFHRWVELKYLSE